MSELRYNPMLNDWIMVASNRQQRPAMPKGWCPFCPGSGNVPDEGYDVLEYDNDFPVMTQEFSQLSGQEGDSFTARPMYGKCEVILYHPNHTITLPELPKVHIRKLVDLWTSRFEALAADKEIKYILIFENRGAEAGVTMPHPHGQLYAFNWLPKNIETEINNSKRHYQETGRCLTCELLSEEQNAKARMVMENDHFAVYVPYYTSYPYGTYVVAKEHVGSLPDFSSEQKDSLADILKRITGTYDTLFNKLFPYMMVMHQVPVNTEDAGDYYHFHIEFYPPLRADGVQYFRASCETGAGAYCNATQPEEKAQDLRDAYERFLAKGEVE